MGFTFDDGDTKGVATLFAEMDELIRKDSRNRERIFPYIGGAEVNESPTHEHRRWVIDFADWPLRREDFADCWKDADSRKRLAWLRNGIVPLDYTDPVASDWPDLLDIVERKVRPDHESDKRESYRRFWWQFAEKRPGLTRVLRTVNRSLVVCRHSPHLTFVRLPANVIGADSLNFIALDTWGAFATLQCRVHEVWARLQGSSIKDDLRYTTTECFETYPFPDAIGSNSLLDEAGRTYYEFRADVMRRRNEGLTTIYNLFHDPGEMSAEVVELRRLHDAMDRAVLDAYGWIDLRPDCEFFSEFDDDDEEDDGRPTYKRKYFRFRWPEDVRDDVLARLLVLNQQRYQEEILAGLHDKPDSSRCGRGKRAEGDQDRVDGQGKLDL